MTRYSILLLTGIIFMLMLGTSTHSVQQSTQPLEQQMPDTEASETDREESNGFEVLSFWGEEGEYEGIQALIQVLKEKYPSSRIIHSASAGGGTGELRTVLQAKIENGNIPDSFIVSSGAKFKELLMDLGALVDTDALQNVFPSALVDHFSADGHMYGMPVNVHRLNVVWYNIRLLKAYDIDPPATIEQLLQAIALLHERRETALVMDSSFNLKSNLLLSTLSLEDYKQFKRGELGEDKANEALAKVQRLIDQLNAYGQTVVRYPTWQEASDRFAAGDAAFYMSGDWSKNYLIRHSGLRLNEDFGWFPFPGTEDVFFATADAFGISRTTDKLKTADEWMSMLASAEGQTAFSLQKGSIPARTDITPDLFDEYSQEAMKAYQNSLREGSFVMAGMDAPPHGRK